jgi:hypothetical protein
MLEFSKSIPLLVLFAVILLPRYAAAETPAPLSFEQHVRPILKAYCLDCHGGSEKLAGNLDLRLKRFAERGGDSGAAFVAGNSAESLLLQRIQAGEMPPGEKKVPREQVAMLERWIAAGAKAGAEPEKLPPGIPITAEERAYWAYQPLQAPAIAKFSPADRVRTPIDAILLTRLRTKGLSFSSDADKRTLLIRAALDLTGLPPSPAEIEAFVKEDRDEAFEIVLTKLLDSPHYGERWGRHWLDVAGYADSDGNGTEDAVRPYAYKYRDYVIRSLNADKPLNQFLIEQLSGDELVAQPWKNLTAQQIELLTATGFLRTAVDGTNGAAVPAEAANLVVADTLKIVSTSLLGLSVGCAQCHDHRYDPISQADYFRLRAVFQPALDPAHWRGPAQRLVSLYTDDDRAKAAQVEAESGALQQAHNTKAKVFLLAALEKELLKFPEDQRNSLRDAYHTPTDKRNEEQKKLLATNPSVNLSPGNLYQYNQAAADELKKDAEKIAAKRAEKPVEDFLSVLNEVPGTVPATHLFHRGDYRQPLQAVEAGDLTIAAPEGKRLELPPKDAALATTGRRLAYAKHLTSGQHPLLGRVLANRIWMHHFGRGIVDTPGDFGFLGSRPSHPELLDYLALQLPTQGWSLKQLHMQIMLSTVYRQSSQRNAAQEAVDDENRLLGHFPVQRLDAEIIRDRILAACGRLERSQFGPAVAVSEDFSGQVMPAGDSARRSIYLQVRRTKPVSFLTTFDAPVMTVNCEKRVTSTSSPQSLMLMNSEFVLAQAAAMATRVRNEAKSVAPGASPGVLGDAIAKLATRFLRPADAWQFGYGTFDEASARTTFTRLPHFTGGAWQGGAALPDPKLGWVIIHAAGGHPGDASHCAIRRFTANQKGTLSISGKLGHASAAGDGVRGRIVSSRHGLAGQWQARHGEAVTEVTKLATEPGDTMDFVVDCIGDVNSDSFSWTVDLKLQDEQGTAVFACNSAVAFQGPEPASLPQLAAAAWRLAYLRDANEVELQATCEFLSTQIASLQQTRPAGDPELAALTSLCQQLLSSNEFLYVE